MSGGGENSKDPKRLLRKCSDVSALSLDRKHNHTEVKKNEKRGTNENRVLLGRDAGPLTCERWLVKKGGKLQNG